MGARRFWARVLTGVAASLGVAAPARAAPQVGADVTLGAASASVGDRSIFAMHAGARADLLLLRARDRDMGLGPWVGFGTEAFRTASVEGGVEWLVPAWGDIPFLFAAGASERADGVTGWRPGVVGALHWGPRSYDFESTYAFSAGLFVEARHSLEAPTANDVIVGVEIDVTLLAYPFLAAASALRR